jgi:hypothetical protein
LYPVSGSPLLKKYAARFLTAIAFLWRSLTPEVSLVINDPGFASIPAPGMYHVAGPLGVQEQQLLMGATDATCSNGV